MMNGKIKSQAPLMPQSSYILLPLSKFLMNWGMLFLSESVCVENVIVYRTFVEIEYC